MKGINKQILKHQYLIEFIITQNDNILFLLHLKN